MRKRKGMDINVFAWTVVGIIIVLVLAYMSMTILNNAAANSGERPEDQCFSQTSKSDCESLEGKECFWDSASETCGDVVSPGVPVDDGGGDGGGESSSPGEGCELPSNAITKSGFESGPMEPFNSGGRQHLSIVNDGYEGKALRVHTPRGSHYGSRASYNFQQAGMNDPEELHAQYAIKFGENWRADRSGKLPGFGGSYASGAGHGGGRVDGTDGWSARGLWEEGSSQTKTRVGYYVYHPDMSGQYGSQWAGDKELQNGQWYCVKQHIKLNDPDKKNGVLEMWVDGDKVVDKNNLRFRTVSRLKIKDYWFNLYYGGTWSAPQDMDIYFDNFAIWQE